MGVLYMLGKYVNTIIWDKKVKDTKQKIDSKAAKRVKKIS
jgi:hypothetical protein